MLFLKYVTIIITNNNNTFKNNILFINKIDNERSKWIFETQGLATLL